jgi:hypothetical protein
MESDTACKDPRASGVTPVSFNDAVKDKERAEQKGDKVIESEVFAW